MLVPEIQFGQIKILSAYFITSVQQHEQKILICVIIGHFHNQEMKKVY